MKKILIIENDKGVSFTLKSQLEKHNYEVFQVFNGSAAMRKILSIAPDCILLDIGLPDKNGFDICMEIRNFYQGTIIFHTAQNDPEIEVTCFKLGADDYVLKSAPFAVLLERMKRLGIKQSRHSMNQKQILEYGEITFIADISDCEFEGQCVGLTQEEYELFYFMAINNTSPVSRQIILQVLKGIQYNGLNRSIDIKVARIRKKLKNIGYDKPVIHSIRSKGYQIAAQSSYMN